MNKKTLMAVSANTISEARFSNIGKLDEVNQDVTSSFWMKTDKAYLPECLPA
jgi:hypothetical protein